MNKKNSLHHAYKCRHILLAMALGTVTITQAQDLHITEGNLVLENSSSLSTEELAGSRGRQGVDTLQQMNENDQRAWLENNRLDADSTGNNVIESGALQGIEGISTVIQNTGNQVVIQESTLLNLTITP